MSGDDTGRMLAASLERILRELGTPAVVRDADLGGAGARAGAGEGDPSSISELLAALEAAGFHAALVDEARGGAGLGWSDVAALLRACGNGAAPVALADTLGAQALARLAGSSLEPGWATFGAGRTGERDPGGGAANGVVVAGLATWRHARTLVVSIRERAEDEAAIWKFALPAGAKGCNLAGEPRATVRLDLAAGERLGTAGGGIDALHVGAAVRSAQLAGACARVVRLAADYARDRVQFGRPIAAFQAIQHQLALAQEWASMAAAASALALADRGVALDRHRVAAAKYVGAQAAQECARVAHAVHGAIGVTAEYDLQLFTRRLWSWAAEFGSQTFWAERLGAELLASGSARSWDQVVRHASLADPAS